MDDTFKEELKGLVNATGDAIAALFVQMERGNWTDDNGHPVSMNTAMLAMQERLVALGEFRARYLGYQPFNMPVTRY